MGETRDAESESGDGGSRVISGECGIFCDQECSGEHEGEEGREGRELLGQVDVGESGDDGEDKTSV